MIFSCTLLVTTMFLLETPIRGITALCTAGVYIVFTFVALIILNKTPSAYAIGFLVGASLLVLVLAFQSALHWGLDTPSNLRHPRAGYVASGLHALIFLVQSVVTTVVVKSKENVIDTYAAYEYIPDNVHLIHRSPFASPVNYHASTPTADI